MSDIAIDSSVLESLAAEKAKEAARKEAAQAGGAPQGASQQDVMALAYYYLVQAATITSENALVQAKQTQANANAQQQLDNEAAQLKWYYVSNLKTTHHKTYIAHTHWHWKFWSHGFHYTTYQKVTWTTHKNQLTVTNQQTKNEQVAAERQFLTQKMGVLQQMASVGETHINSINDEASQSMQESSQILQIIQNLTFQALLRPKPQS